MKTVAALAIALLLGSSLARGQWGTYPGPPPPPPTYRDYAPEVTANRVPYPIFTGPGYYYYDPVNRAYPLTPEPVWRSIFPGIRARVQAEVREFGVPGITEQELRYWRWMVWRARIGED